MKIRRFNEAKKEIHFPKDTMDIIKDCLYSISDDFDTSIKQKPNNISIEIKSNVSNDILISDTEMKKYQESLSKRSDIIERCREFINRVDKSLTTRSTKYTILPSRKKVVIDILFITKSEKELPISVHSHKDKKRFVINKSKLTEELEKIRGSSISIEFDDEDIFISSDSTPKPMWKRIKNYMENLISPYHRCYYWEGYDDDDNLQLQINLSGPDTYTDNRGNDMDYDTSIEII